MKYYKKLLMLLSLFFLCATSASAVINPNDDVAYWSLNNTLADATGVTGSITNSGGSFSTNGIINASVDLPGAGQFLERPDFNIPGGSVAISLWAQSDINQLPGDFDTLFRWADASTGGDSFCFWSYTSANELFCGFENTGGSAVGSFSIVKNLSTGWHHYLININSTAVEMFIDGVSEGSDYTLTGTVETNNNMDFLFGECNFACSQSFNGRFDEIAIFNRSLLAEDAVTLNNSGMGLPFPFVIPSTTLSTTIKPFYNSTNISVQINASDPLNLSYSLDGASEVSVWTNQNNGSVNITGISQGLHNITWVGATANLSELFVIDTIVPDLNVTSPSESNSYTINFSSLITFNDTNFDACVVTVEGGTTPCINESYLFVTNGNHSFNVSVNDSAGNINVALNNLLFINPEFRVHFNNNTANVQNFTINGTAYVDYFNGSLYDFGFGNHTFSFQKTGFAELNFTLEFTNTSDINQTIFINEVYIIFNLKNIVDGSMASLANYSFVLTNNESTEIDTYNIVNSNNLTIINNFANNVGLQISVIQNDSITNTVTIVTARQNVTVDIYLTEVTTEQRVIEVITGNLIVIPDQQVYLYKFIDGVPFVLQTIKVTNVLGQVVFDIIPLTAIYNVCSTYQGEEKCLSSVTFENAATDPFQIKHSLNSTATEITFLPFITWNPSVAQTNETINVTMTFEDEQALVSSFCYNVSRLENSTLSFVGEFCNNNYVGQEVNTFGLVVGQRLDVQYYYYLDAVKEVLASASYYPIDLDLSAVDQNNLFDILFLFVYVAGMGILLGFKKFDIYNIGILSILLIVLAIQSYFSKNYVSSVGWLFVAVKTLALYMYKEEA